MNFHDFKEDDKLSKCIILIRDLKIYVKMVGDEKKYECGWEAPARKMYVLFKVT